ncbi:dTDP-4-dehydrorhamnose 3,5-epimerase [Pseudoalteromonas phenolica]|uniref:dTDP-4-dehydrorhamnose 3,5-epimerase n=1 Tax=Pseudoalteromonas phenolica TaxID=161398 RepID=A0A0S2JXS8_9GAMM|nr:dTDP-4-dehydrorhamnose 3,5-epimerase [Pseudoalteromonas phenolica]ALO40944.1 dTDP-4-dehydrorhamnose 3,5-epimerase [Pseudoalteromonas phenolica]MBE0354533.1 dTDP-4-dehydrorhamnose 3,5-epimerase [Pseudoalteromonas phenolica O-BC30]RXF05548.1 dTDP-4-dehydrorhamnose 3,5-epimerase [Pseudoalteromonas phenolica O-BC30]
MNIIETAIPDVKILEPKVFGDDRGFFMETFREEWFRGNVADVTFVQDNHSKSSQGILRGLHYQTEQTQGKLVRVTQGEVYDVAVDMRKDSPTFGKHVGVLLSAENKRQLWVPEGFAHGFYVTTESAEFVYKCTNYYAPQFEQSVLWNDPALDIQWPLVNGQSPLLSEKDKAGLLLVDAPVF